MRALGAEGGLLVVFCDVRGALGAEVGVLGCSLWYMSALGGWEVDFSTSVLELWGFYFHNYKICFHAVLSALSLGGKEQFFRQ